MKFHGLLVLRDEIDVVEECLEHLLSWLDYLYVMDLGSTDGTWKKIREMAKSDDRIVLYGSEPVVYNDALRSFMFDRFRDRFESGDWICKVDADEFYEVTPPEFVDRYLEKHETAIWLQWYFFRLTQQEVAAYEDGKIDIIEDRKQSICSRRKYYKITEHAEPRSFRYRKSMKWSEHNAFPYNAGLVAKMRIPIKHFPHRDPLQMKARYALRSAMMNINPDATGSHWKLKDWTEDVIDTTTSADESLSRCSGLASVAGHTSGGLLLANDDSEFPATPMDNQLPGPAKRLALRFAYACIVPLLDLIRRPYDKDATVDLIPQEITDHLMLVESEVLHD